MSLRPRILVVDDEAHAADVARLLLEQQGYDVVGVAHSGDDAITSAQRLLPDLILMDIVLGPGIDGIEAAEIIQRDYNIPVVYLSSYTNDDLLKRAGDSEAFGYLLKPYTERELVVAISVVLQKSKSEIGLKEAASLSNTLMSLCDGIISTDLEGTIHLINPSALKLIGIDYDQLIGKPLQEVINFSYHKDGAPLPDLISTTISNNTTLFFEDIVFGDSPYILNVNTSPLTNKHGALVGVAIMLRDMSKQYALHNALLQSEDKFRKVAETTSGGILVHRNHILYANRASESISGYSVDELLHMGLLELIHPDDRESVKQRIQRRLEGDSQVMRYETRFRNKTGEVRWLDVSSSMMQLDGQPTGLATVFDITERKLAEAKLFQEKEKAQVTLESIAEGVITTDKAGLIEYMNPMAEQLTGWSIAEAVGKHHQQIIHLLDELSGTTLKDPVAQCMATQTYLRLSDRLSLHSTKEGDLFIVELTVSPLRDNANNIIGAVLFLHDITQLRGMEQRLAYQANHDPMTGLINRREFERRLQQTLDRAHQEHSKHAMCYLDLDQFKIVNDTCGHIAGDQLLKQLSSQLQLCIREHDTLARLGGDEFGALLVDCTIDQAKELAHTLLDTVRHFRFTWEGKVFEVGVSVGLMPITAASGSLAEILSMADSACYVAKDKGRNHIHVYQPNDYAISKRQGEMQWVQRINQAFKEKRFKLYHQRVTPLNRKEDKAGIEYYELLLRMTSKGGKIYAPTHFIPAAERYHIMPAIDHWVIRVAFEMLAQQGLLTHASRIYAINLSGQSLGDENFIKYVCDQLDQSQAPANTICFEITETAAISNIALATRFIATLKERGCFFALDDFGTGLSSFEYLKNLPVDFLKIDGGFVRNMINDPINYAIVESINQIGHVMGIQTIAECVENAYTLTALRALNVDYAQGREVGAPMAINPHLGTLVQ